MMLRLRHFISLHHEAVGALSRHHHDYGSLVLVQLARSYAFTVHMAQPIYSHIASQFPCHGQVSQFGSGTFVRFLLLLTLDQARPAHLSMILWHTLHLCNIPSHHQFSPFLQSSVVQPLLGHMYITDLGDLTPVPCERAVWILISPRRPSLRRLSLSHLVSLNCTIQ